MPTFPVVKYHLVSSAPHIIDGLGAGDGLPVHPQGVGHLPGQRPLALEVGPGGGGGDDGYGVGIGDGW